MRVSSQSAFVAELVIWVRDSCDLELGWNCVHYAPPTGLAANVQC